MSWDSNVLAERLREVAQLQGRLLGKLEHATKEADVASVLDDLMAEFSDIKDFSRRNLELIRQWYTYWSSDIAIAKQAVSQLAKIENNNGTACLTIGQQPVVTVCC